jgi:peptidoglycan hydrolase-like protein with peptidoglycan-binding domain
MILVLISTITGVILSEDISYATDTTTSASTTPTEGGSTNGNYTTKPTSPIKPVDMTPVEIPTNISAFSRILSFGKIGEDVKMLQTILNKLGSKLGVDGSFGYLTKNEVLNFQSKYKLVMDGIVGTNTSKALFYQFNPHDATTKNSTLAENNVELMKLISDNTILNLGIFKSIILNEDLIINTGKTISLGKIDQYGNHYQNLELSAPKLNVIGDKVTFVNGTINSDIYVNASDFKLDNVDVNGIVYFETQVAKDTFTSINSNVKTKLVQLDAITTASIVDDEQSFKSVLGPDGKWIIASLTDLTFDEELVLEGTFTNGKKNTDGTDQIDRKIGMYSQDDKRNVTRKFTLSTPKLTIKSPNTRIGAGIYETDIYIESSNVQLQKASVHGNIYFLNQEAKNTFKFDTASSVTGNMTLIDVDAITSSSITRDEDTFLNGISSEGKWIVAILKDMSFDTELVLEGIFKNGKKNADGTDAIDRKIAPYTQITDPISGKKIPTRLFTLQAPKLTINSPNTRLGTGIYKTDVYVNSDNFQFQPAPATIGYGYIDGNLYFTTQSAYNSAKINSVLIKDMTSEDKHKYVTGVIALKQVDVVTTASITDYKGTFESAMSRSGNWLIASTQDFEFTHALYLDGSFVTGKKDEQGNDVVGRKLALYSQDDKRNIVHSFTLTAPKLWISSPNSKIQGGTFVGDLYVLTNNFSLVKANVKGDIYFKTQTAMDSFIKDEYSTVTGELKLIN